MSTYSKPNFRVFAVPLRNRNNLNALLHKMNFGYSGLPLGHDNLDISNRFKPNNTQLSVVVRRTFGSSPAFEGYQEHARMISMTWWTLQLGMVS